MMQPSEHRPPPVFRPPYPPFSFLWRGHVWPHFHLKSKFLGKNPGREIFGQVRPGPFLNTNTLSHPLCTLVRSTRYRARDSGL
jgi:hypothetical protein